MTWPVTPDVVRRRVARTSTQVPDDDVQPFIDAATAYAEDRVGPSSGQSFRTIVRTSYRYRIRSVQLKHRAASISAVTLDDVPVAGFEFDPDESSYQVQFASPIGPGKVVVVAVAPLKPPNDVANACAEHAAHLFRQATMGAGGMEGAATPMGYAVPNRVEQVYAANAEPVLG